MARSTVPGSSWMRGGLADHDTKSMMSYRTVDTRKPAEVDQEAFLKLQEEYLRCKKDENAMQLQLKQLAGKLIRTEDVAKKALLAASNGGSGRALATQLIDVERDAARLASQKAALERRLDSEQQKAACLQEKTKEQKRRVEEVLRDQRYLVQRLARSGPVASGRASGALAAPGAGTARPGSVRPASMAGTVATGGPVAQQLARLAEDVRELQREKSGLRSEQLIAAGQQMVAGKKGSSLGGGSLMSPAMSQKLAALQHRRALSRGPSTLGIGRSIIMPNARSGLCRNTLHTLPEHQHCTESEVGRSPWSVHAAAHEERQQQQQQQMQRQQQLQPEPIRPEVHQQQDDQHQPQLHSSLQPPTRQTTGVVHNALLEHGGHDDMHRLLMHFADQGAPAAAGQLHAATAPLRAGEHRAVKTLRAQAGQLLQELQQRNSTGTAEQSSISAMQGASQLRQRAQALREAARQLKGHYSGRSCPPARSAQPDRHRGGCRRFQSPEPPTTLRDGSAAVRKWLTDDSSSGGANCTSGVQSCVSVTSGSGVPGSNPGGSRDAKDQTSQHIAAAAPSQRLYSSQLKLPLSASRAPPAPRFVRLAGVQHCQPAESCPASPAASSSCAAPGPAAARTAASHEASPRCRGGSTYATSDTTGSDIGADRNSSASCTRNSPTSTLPDAVYKPTAKRLKRNGEKETRGASSAAETGVRLLRAAPAGGGTLWRSGNVKAAAPHATGTAAQRSLLQQTALPTAAFVRLQQPALLDGACAKRLLRPNAAGETGAVPAVDRDGALDGGLSDGASAPPLPSPAAGTSPAMPGVAPVGRPPCDYTATEERLGPQRTSTPDGCLETLRPEVHHREEERGKHQSGQPDHPCRPPGNAAAGDHQGAAGARPQPALSTQQHPQCAEGAHVVPVLSLAPPASCTPHRSAQHAGRCLHASRPRSAAAPRDRRPPSVRVKIVLQQPRGPSRGRAARSSHCRHRCFDSARQHRSGADCKRRTVLVDASTAKPRQEATTTTPQRPAQAFNGHHRARSAERSCASSSVTICSHVSSASSSSSPTSSSSSPSSPTSSSSTSSTSSTSSSQSQGQSRILCRVRSSSSGSAEGREAGPSICPAEQSPSRAGGDGRQAPQRSKASEPALQQTSHNAAGFAAPEGDWLDLTGQVAENWPTPDDHLILAVGDVCILKSRASMPEAPVRHLEVEYTCAPPGGGTRRRMHAPVRDAAENGDCSCSHAVAVGVPKEPAPAVASSKEPSRSERDARYIVPFSLIEHTALRRRVIGQAGIDLRAVAALGQDLVKAPLQLEAADGSLVVILQITVLISRALAQQTQAAALP